MREREIRRERDRGREERERNLDTFKLPLNTGEKEKKYKTEGKRKICNISLFLEEILKPQNIHLGTIYVHCPNTQ